MTTVLVYKDISKLVLCIQESIKNDQTHYTVDLAPNDVETLLKNVKNEWDRETAKLLFASGKINVRFGLRPETFLKTKQQIMKRTTECSHAVDAATDIVKLRLSSRQQALTDQLERKTQELNDRGENLPSCWKLDMEHQLEEMREQLESLRDMPVCYYMIVNMKYGSLVSIYLIILKARCIETRFFFFFIQDTSSSSSRKRITRAVKRTATSLISEHRIKDRKLGAGYVHP